MSDVRRRPYGVGLAYRPDIHAGIMRHAREIDVLEIATVDYLVRYRRLGLDPREELLGEALRHFPAVTHGICMSIGSVEPHDEATLGPTADFLGRHGIGEHTEHLTFHRMGGVDPSMFMCLPFEEASARWVAAKYRQARRRLGVPLGLENVSYYYPVPGCAYREAEFLTRVAELTGCFLLLDVTNVYNNATNHGYDPVEFIRRLPGDRVKHLHLAGGYLDEGRWVDSHSRPVMAPVWDLLEEVLRLTKAEVVILERDSDYEPFERTLMPDVRRAREIFYRHRPARAADWPSVPTVDAPAGPSCEELLAEPEVIQLQRFQQATIGLLSRSDVYEQWRQDPRAAAARFGLQGRWAEMWAGCDRRMLDRLHHKGLQILREEEEDRETYRRWEWSQWRRKGGAGRRQAAEAP